MIKNFAPKTVNPLFFEDDSSVKSGKFKHLKSLVHLHLFRESLFRILSSDEGNTVG